MKNTALPPDILKGFISPPDDLSFLSVTSRESVEKFVRDLNAAKADGKKLVAAIGTGGTISMKIENGVRVPDLDFKGIFDMSDRRLGAMYEVVGLDAFQIDSSQMNYSHIRDLAIIMAHVYKNVRAPYIGFLVLHGTDTMSYSSAAVSLMMGQGLPFSVVYTGAQKPIQEPMNDAFINIRNALYTLDSLHAANMAEVVVVMGDGAVLGTSSEKISDQQANAFSAPLHKYVARFNFLEYPVRLASWLNERRAMEFVPKIWHGDYSHTLLVKSALGLDPAVVRGQVADERIQAVLLYSYGAGTIHGDIIDAVMDGVAKRGIPVFLVSPVHAMPRGTYESGRQLIEKGGAPLFMTLSAALAKIEVALRMHPGDAGAVSRFMTSNYVGEVPDKNSRFSEYE